MKENAVLFDLNFGVAVHKLPADFVEDREESGLQRRRPDLLGVEELAKREGVVGRSPESAPEVRLGKNRFHRARSAARGFKRFL